MGKYRVFRAIFIRTLFVIHSLVAIGQVVYMKDDNFYWYLCTPLFFMILETVVTLTLRKNLEWNWFCPSVFLYLASIVPAIWLLELDKVERKLKALEDLPMNFTTGGQLKELSTIIGGVQIRLPEITMSTETWITLIEQFLMLILIIGRWMLPKGDLTRDQLSQLLLVYIGTAADIIEFFDSFKDDKIATHQVLVFLTLGIWSWSLMQFTVVLTATKSRKSRLGTTTSLESSDSCCTIDVCSILLNILLQDAPFLVFRLLLIAHYQIITYMNIFFTCKNTLVILLQIYRLYVVYSEPKKKKGANDVEMSNISIISSLSKSDLTFEPRRRRRPSQRGPHRPTREDTFRSQKSSSTMRSGETEDSNDSDESRGGRKNRRSLNSRKDTGYSTASSHASVRNNIQKSQSKRSNISNGTENTEARRLMKQKLKRSDRETRGGRRLEETVSEESDATYEEEVRRDKARKEHGMQRERSRDRQRDKRYEKGSTVTASDHSSD